MKFIEAPQFGGPEVLTVVETETPTPSEGMLLVDVKAAGLNYADIMARSGFYPQVPKAPFALGFEIAGVVTEVGKSVEGFKEGDSVAAITLAGGGYATHAMIPAATAIPLPTGFNHALAVALLVQGLTAYILLDEARVKEGDTVLIAAAGGGLGNIAVQLAKARGAKVIGLTSRSKFELVKNLGADHVADYEEAGWAVTIKDKIGEKGIQVYLDSIGDLATEAFPLLGQFAQWIIFGVRSGEHHPFPVESIFAMVEKNITLRGFNLEGSLQLVPQALSALFKAVAEGGLKLETTKYPLSEAVKVHQLFEARKTTGKVVLIP